MGSYSAPHFSGDYGMEVRWDPSVRLDMGVKRSARGEKCRNISRRHLGISWFLRVLFVSTCIVRAAQFSKILKNGTIVIKLLSKARWVADLYGRVLSLR